MPITLAEAKVGMADRVKQEVIDTFRRSSLLMDRMVWDNTISPGTGGSTLTYGYVQLKTPSTAGIRAINTEYTPNEAKREQKSATCVIMGGSFSVDRVIQKTSGAINELSFQAEQKIKATANEFHYLAINGAAAASPGAGYKGSTWDGLKQQLAGTSNEFTTTIDLSSAAAMNSNYQAFLDELDALVAAIDGSASMLMMNKHMLTKLRGIARRADYYERSRDEFGRVVELYNGIPLVDLGGYYDPTQAKTIDTVATSTPTSSAFGTTDIYAVDLSLDAWHGISVAGTGIIEASMPDLRAPGAVKTGDVELVAATVLKNTTKAAVLHGIGIKPKS